MPVTSSACSASPVTPPRQLLITLATTLIATVAAGYVGLMAGALANMSISSPPGWGWRWGPPFAVAGAATAAGIVTALIRWSERVRIGRLPPPPHEVH